MRNLYMWLAICAILGWSHTLLNRPFAWLSWARQAVFPWYILHQSAIVLLAYWLVPCFGLPARPRQAVVADTSLAAN